MKTLILALAAAATLGLAAPASASDSRGSAVQSQAQDFSSGHRHHWRRHHWRRPHHGWRSRHCQRVWRHGHWATVCRW